MKIAQFLCFSPDLAEEEITAVHVLPETPQCNRQRRWQRRLAGIIFPILIRPQANSYNDASPSTLSRGGQFSNRKSTFALESSSVRKSDSDDYLGSDEVIFSPSSSSAPKTPSSSSSSCSLSSPISPAKKSKEAVEEVSERRCALCFLLLSLMVMVFCGRICAILWTTSGLCLLSRRKPAPPALEFGVAEKRAVSASALSNSAVDLRRRGFCEYDKRRVVLEGFLGRSKRV